MIRTSLIAGALLAGPCAMAGISPPSAADIGGLDGGQPPIQTVTTGGVVQGDSASMSLVMIDANDNSVTVNMGGEFSVTRGPTFTNIGANRNGGGNLLASWDEVIQGSNVFINAVIRTSDGSMFMPPTATVNGQPAFFWTWHFGTANPVNFQPWVTSVNLMSARIFFSDNGGASFNSFSNISGLGGSFLQGRDNGNYLASIGDGTNYIMLQYQIQPVPAPAGVGAVMGGVLLLARRRRR
jgi:hypothetical protein